LHSFLLSILENKCLLILLQVKILVEGFNNSFGNTALGMQTAFGSTCLGLQAKL